MSLLSHTHSTGQAADSKRSTGRQYWRSLEELADTPDFQQFLHREFPEQASELENPVTRRSFLQLMAASFALAGGGMLTACRRPVNNILPHSTMPEYNVPGIPKYYASSFEYGGNVTGLVVKSFDGRPVKVEGNTLHPASAGSTTGPVQASILELYDPDRLQEFTGPNGATRADFEKKFAAMSQSVRQRRGAGLHILSDLNSSPTLLAVRDRFLQQNPQAQWHTWQPVNEDAVVAGSRMALGQFARPLFDFAKADVVLAVDSDFLNAGPDQVRSQRGFASRRRAHDPAHPVTMNRLYAVEGVLSITGAMADHRLRIPSSKAAGFLFAVAATLISEHHLLPAGHPLAGGQLNNFVGAYDAKWVKAVAKDLAAHRGHAVISVGPEQPAVAHAVALILNLALAGDAMKLVPLQDPSATNQLQSVTQLAEALHGGHVETLVILGGNPAFDAPANLDFAGALAKAANTVHLTLHANETTAACQWAVPAAHTLESWGDTRSTDGTVASVQPLIAPLFDGLTPVELIDWLASGEQKSAYDIVRENMRGGQDEALFASQWSKFLHDGVLADSTHPGLSVSPSFNLMPLIGALGAINTTAPAKGSYEVVFRADPAIFDGRFSNNGWLQETPDPISKLTWDNAALMSYNTAQDLGIQGVDPVNHTADMVTIEVNGASVEMAAWIVPGMADHVICLQLGYGRQTIGRVGVGTGRNVYPLRVSSSLWNASGAKVTKSRKGYPNGLGTVQNHWALETDRDLVLEKTVGAAAAAHAADTHAAEPQAEAAHAADSHAADAHGAESHVAGAAMAGAAHEAAHADHGHHDWNEVYDETQLWKDAGHIQDRQTGETSYYDEGVQWGMVIDLSTCTGCNACMVACQSENNIPIVGKEQIKMGREMHWIRLDRYWKGAADDPEGMVIQPITCQHCETAPCEQVCPVAATTHSPDGLNEMTYNRCIGTRYCLNNCPYKVRRFNFFNYHDKNTTVWTSSDMLKTNGTPDLYDGGNPDLVAMASNPDVSVRSRGVMEKCTYCVQRLSRAKQIARLDGNRAVRDGEAITACQQVCPSQAIVFGDINDAESQVSHQKALEDNYSLLNHLRTRPRTSFLPKLRNLNPELV